MKKDIKRIKVAFLLCIGLSLMLGMGNPAGAGSSRRIIASVGDRLSEDYSSIMDILFLVTSRQPAAMTIMAPMVMNRVVPMPPVSGSMEPVLLTT